MQTDNSEEMYLIMPNDEPTEALELGYQPGGIYPMLKVVYGRIDAPRLFTQAFQAAVDKETWVECDESILIKVKGKTVVGIMFMHMDDLFVFSDDPVRQLKMIDKHFKLGSIQELKEDELCIYTGLDFKWMPSVSRYQISQGRYLKALNTGLSDKQKRRVFGVHDLRKSEPGEVNKKLEKVQQACMVWDARMGV